MAEANSQTDGPVKGLPALKAHIIANKIDVALWATRLFTLLFASLYIIPLTNPINAYYKALACNAATSALRLHQRIPAASISLSTQFLGRLYMEDSAHYLFYTVIFMYAPPQMLVLWPVVLFAVLHAASYSLTLLDTLGQNSMWVARLLISLVEFQSRNILRMAAFAEIALFPMTVFMVLFGSGNLITPFVYYQFIILRYSSRRNPYTRNTFHELRILTERTASKPSLPSPIRSALLSLVSLTCNLAPPLHQEQQ